MQTSDYLNLLEKYKIAGAHPGGLSATKKMLAGLRFEDGTKLIDLGCGTGQTLAYIAETYRHKLLVGVDNSSCMLSQADQRFGKRNLSVDLIQADVTQLPFPSGMFDIALSESVTVFTPHIGKALGEYARVLKEGGVLLIVEMTAESPFSKQELNGIKSVYGIGQVPDCTGWETLLKEAGFTEISSFEVKMTPTVRFTSRQMVQDFAPHLNAMKRYGKRLKYMTYKCVKL